MFILPSFLIYTLFVIVPTVGSIYLSFTSWDGISEDVRYIGFANFVEIWNSPRVHNALKNTLLMTVSLVVLENIAAIALAILVDKVRWFRNLFRSIFISYSAQRDCNGVCLGHDFELQLWCV